MKLLILLVSIVSSTQATDIEVEFTAILGAGGVAADVKYIFNEQFDFDAFNFTSFVDITAPYPTRWTYSANYAILANGNDDFCNPDDPDSPGGVAIQILRETIGFGDSSCPIPKQTSFPNRKWKQSLSVNLDQLFASAADILGIELQPAIPDIPDVDVDVPVPMDPVVPDTSDAVDMPPDSSVATDPGSSSSDEAAANPPPASGPGGMKRRRRYASPLTITLNAFNDCVTTVMKLSLKTV